MLHLTIDKQRGWFMRCPVCNVNLSVSIAKGKVFRCIICKTLIPSTKILKENKSMRIAWHKSSPYATGEDIKIEGQTVLVD